MGRSRSHSHGRHAGRDQASKSAYGSEIQPQALDAVYGAGADRHDVYGSVAARVHSHISVPAEAMRGGVRGRSGTGGAPPSRLRPAESGFLGCAAAVADGAGWRAPTQARLSAATANSPLAQTAAAQSTEIAVGEQLGASRGGVAVVAVAGEGEKEAQLRRESAVVVAEQAAAAAAAAAIKAGDGETRKKKRERLHLASSSAYTQHPTPAALDT